MIKIYNKIGLTKLLATLLNHCITIFSNIYFVMVYLGFDVIKNAEDIFFRINKIYFYQYLKRYGS